MPCRACCWSIFFRELSGLRDDELGDFCADLLDAEFVQAAVVERAFGHAAGAAGDVGVENAVDPAEGPEDLGVAGAEEDGGGDAEVGRIVGEDPIIGEKRGAASEGLEERGELWRIACEDCLIAQTAGEFAGFRSGEAMAEDDDFQLGGEQEFGDLEEAFLWPPIGRPKLRAGGDGDAGDARSVGQRWGLKIFGKHRLHTELVDEGHVVTDPVLRWSEWLGELKRFVEVGAEFGEAVSEALLDPQFREGFRGVGRVPSNRGFILHFSSLDRRDDFLGRGAIRIGNDVVDVLLPFPERGERSGGGDGNRGVRSTIAEGANGGRGQAGFERVGGRSDDQIAAAQVQGGLVWDRMGLGHFSHGADSMDVGTERQC